MNPIYQPCPSASTPSGSTKQREFLDPMLARRCNSSGFEADFLDIMIAAALAENTGLDNRYPHLNSEGPRFQSVTKTGTDLGINGNSTAATGDHNLENVNPTGEGEDINVANPTGESNEANPTRKGGEYEERLTTLLEDEMELDALRDQGVLHAQIKCLPAYFKAEVNELYYEFQRQLYLLAIQNRIYAALFYTHLLVKSTTCKVQRDDGGDDSGIQS
ncbi:hypothetical protein Pst134EB_022311 [Puccinia striiformis f. sp. tritici]|nr:hypothetical protein Pst134EB_022311 [Puccinia striiformis f. sp. tritici]